MPSETLPLHSIRRFPIEEGHIMMFARAIGDPNPIYRDRDYAAKSDVGGIIAPPTFAEAGLHFDDAFPFRPKIGERWWGSAREPRNGPNPMGDHGGTHFHASTTFDYYELLRPGMVLHASPRPGRTWEKDGKRSGRLRFRETIVEFRDASERLVLTSTTAAVSTERKVDQPPAAPAAAEPAAWRRPDHPSAYPVRRPRASELSPGMRFEERVVEDLPRAQILLYAGASGDFSPQHTDEIFNTQVEGYKSVFAHGMLSMGMTARMLTDWLGDGRLTRFHMEFHAQVWPGDSLTARATVKAIREQAGEPLVELDVVTTNQGGATVLVGSATARIER
jgi:acyl dehydratase